LASSGVPTLKNDPGGADVSKRLVLAVVFSGSAATGSLGAKEISADGFFFVISGALGGSKSGDLGSEMV